MDALGRAVAGVALVPVVEHHGRGAEPFGRLHRPAVRRGRVAPGADQQDLRRVQVLDLLPDVVGALGPPVAEHQLGQPVGAEDGRGLLVRGPQPGQVPGQPLGVRAVGVVRAVHRHQRGRQIVHRDVLGVDDGVVGPRRRGRRPAGRQRLHAAGVPVLHQLGERALQQRPHLLGVEALGDGAGQVLTGELVTEVGRHRILVERVDQLHHLRTGVPRVLPERTGEFPRAPGEEVLQRRLLPPRARQPLLGQRLRQGVHTVQRHAPHLPGEARRVHRAQPGAVGEPQVVELLVAERLAQDVEVAGDVHGADVLQDRARVLGALGGHLAQLPQHLARIGHLLPVGRLQRPAGGVGAAADR